MKHSILLFLVLFFSLSVAITGYAQSSESYTDSIALCHMLSIAQKCFSGDTLGEQTNVKIQMETGEIANLWWNESVPQISVWWQIGDVIFTRGVTLDSAWASEERVVADGYILYVSNEYYMPWLDLKCVASGAIYSVLKQAGCSLE